MIDVGGIVVVDRGGFNVSIGEVIECCHSDSLSASNCRILCGDGSIVTLTAIDGASRWISDDGKASILLLNENIIGVLKRLETMKKAIKSDNDELERLDNRIRELRDVERDGDTKLLASIIARDMIEDAEKRKSEISERIGGNKLETLLDDIRKAVKEC